MPEDEQETGELVGPRPYGHVARALYEHPWALQPRMLSLLATILDFRQAGGSLSPEDIRERIAAADNGPRSGSARSGSVAVIPMYGVISQRQSLMSDTSGGTSVDALRQALRGALNDPNVKAIVFDVDSPGGDVAGVTEFASEMRAARAGTKPIIAVANTLAASAAYWLASQCDELVCTPSGEVGSVGVYALHEDDSAAVSAAGVKMTFISAGPYKTEGNAFEPLTDDARANIQGQVDQFYAMFLADVAQGRGASVDEIAANYGEGRTMLAAAAQKAGMVDRVDTLENTVARLARGGGSKVRGQAESESPAVEVLPFAERAIALAAESAAVAAHALGRGELRAKEGRPALSASTESALRSSRDALTTVLATVHPQPSDTRPAPTRADFVAHLAKETTRR